MSDDSVQSVQLVGLVSWSAVCSIMLLLSVPNEMQTAGSFQPGYCLVVEVARLVALLWPSVLPLLLLSILPLPPTRSLPLRYPL